MSFEIVDPENPNILKVELTNDINTTPAIGCYPNQRLTVNFPAAYAGGDLEAWSINIDDAAGRAAAVRRLDETGTPITIDASQPEQTHDELVFGRVDKLCLVTTAAVTGEAAKVIIKRTPAEDKAL